MSRQPPAHPGAVRDCLRRAVGTDWRELRLLLEAQARELEDCVRGIAGRRAAAEGEMKSSQDRLTTTRSIEQLLASLIERHGFLAGRLLALEEPDGETEGRPGEGGSSSESQTGRDYDAWIRRALARQPPAPVAPGGGAGLPPG